MDIKKDSKVCSPPVRRPCHMKTQERFESLINSGPQCVCGSWLGWMAPVSEPLTSLCQMDYRKWVEGLVNGCLLVHREWSESGDGISLSEQI